MWKVYKKGYLGEMSFKAIFLKFYRLLLRGYFGTNVYLTLKVRVVIKIRYLPT